MVSLSSVICAILLAAVLIEGSPMTFKNATVPKRLQNKRIYVHLMPWFETRATSENGAWGIHWTMNTQNPDIIIDESQRRQIAAYYYPDINLYGSGDFGLIDYQIQMMRYGGIDGVLVDWPGTAPAFDYPKNRQNADNFISRLESAGLEFGIVYEDHNLGLAQEGGFIDNIHEQGRRDMQFLQDNYFRRNNYMKINGAPMLMTFGPQTLNVPSDWEQIFSVLDPKPTFLTLWYQQHQAEPWAKGEYPWIYSDFMEGLRNFYNNRPLGVKFGVCYPGFHTFYAEGGWGGPGWSIEPVGPGIFGQTLDAALSSDVQWIQVATWNDYGEGTIVEPTREFGNQFLTMLQKKLGVEATEKELDLIKDIYLKRKHFEGRSDIQAQLDAANDAMNAYQPQAAEKILKAIVM